MVMELSKGRSSSGLESVPSVRKMGSLGVSSCSRFCVGGSAQKECVQAVLGMKNQK